MGFVLILTGRRDEGLRKLENFCAHIEAGIDNRVLQEYISAAEKMTDANQDSRKGR